MAGGEAEIGRQFVGHKDWTIKLIYFWNQFAILLCLARIFAKFIFMQTILSNLQKIETERQVKIVYACEAGSRAWGFASPDSDFDVRIVYTYPKDTYLSIYEPTDHFSFMEKQEEAILDFSGWDLRKVLGNMRKSNAVVFEWLQSPIVYQEQDAFRSRLLEVALSYFSAKSIIFHYLGICHNTIKTYISGDRIKIKKYFYILRPLLAAKWVADRNTIPPVEFCRLLELVQDNSGLIVAIGQLLAEKQVAKEGKMISLRPEIEEFVAEERARLTALSEQMPHIQMDPETLNVFFREALSKY